MSMADGEYVPVSSQADTERADLDRERKELAADPKQEQKEMTEIYIGVGWMPHCFERRDPVDGARCARRSWT